MRSKRATWPGRSLPLDIVVPVAPLPPKQSKWAIPAGFEPPSGRRKSRSSDSGRQRQPGVLDARSPPATHIAGDDVPAQIAMFQFRVREARQIFINDRIGVVVGAFFQ